MNHARIPLSKQARRQPAAQREANGSARAASGHPLDDSPRQLAQRQRLQSAFGHAVQLKIANKSAVTAVVGDSKAGAFGGLQCSLFYAGKGYPHIHATEVLLAKAGKGKAKRDVYLINDIHYSDGTNTFWWKDQGGTFTPTGSTAPTTQQRNLAVEFVNGWGAVA